MNDNTKTKTTIIVPCSQCSTLNRVELEYLITPAKTSGEELERKEMEDKANAEKEKAEKDAKAEEEKKGAKKDAKPDAKTS